MEPQRVQMETVFFYVSHFLGVSSKLRLALKRIFVAAKCKKELPCGEYLYVLSCHTL